MINETPISPIGASSAPDPLAILPNAAGEPDNAGRRTIVPLNDDWRFQWGAAKGDPRADGFDDSAWRTVGLPHDAQFERPWTQEGSNASRGFKPMGEMWYRRTFRLSDIGPEVDGKRLFLELGGLLFIGDVYLNGQMVASTEYGYLPVWADLTPALRREGDNVLAIWCSTGPVGGSRWYTGAGLFRDAGFVVKPSLAIARHGVFVKSRPGADGTASVNISVELDGFRCKGLEVALDVVAEIRDASGAVVATATARAPWSKLNHQEVALPEMTIANVRLWDLDTPNLYTADVRIVMDGEVLDRDTVRFGVRSVEFDPAFGMKLNGRKVFLKSISNHHDLGPLGAAAYCRAIRRQLEFLKLFGYNALRCSNNPYSEDFYELADEMGVLVMDELIDKWSDTSCWAGRKPFTAIWPQMVTAWMKRDRNHPSVFAWSLGNEVQQEEKLCGYPDVGDWGVTMFKVMRAFADRWDDTRPKTVAMFPSHAGAVFLDDPGFMVDPHPPEMSLVTDIAAYNYVWKAYPSYVRHAPHLCIFQSEAQVKQLQAPYFGMDREHTIGCSYWGAIEYWGESKGWPRKGWTFSLFTRDLEPYPGAYLVESAMRPEKPIVRIAVENGEGESMTWNAVDVGCRDEFSAWEGTPGARKAVRVYTNLPEVELFLNGRSLGCKANDSDDPEKKNVVEYSVPFEPGELTARADDVSHSLRTAGAPVALRVEVQGKDFRADGRDLVYVHVAAVDETGTLVLSATNRVVFACTGAASFLCCDDGDPATDLLFTPAVNAKNLYNGTALGVFRCGTEPGEATINVTADGLPPVVLNVEVGGAV